MIRASRRRSESIEWSDRPLRDLIQPNLDILFVGLNPSTRSAQRGHFYAGPGNLFWPHLYASGLVPEPVTFAEDKRVLEFAIGITDLVARHSPTSGVLRPEEFRAGFAELEAKVARFRPRIVAFNGLSGYRAACDKEAQPGLQLQRLAGALVFLLPSSSRRNANYTIDERLDWFRRLRMLRESLVF